MDEITNSKLSRAMQGNSNHNKKVLSNVNKGSRNKKAKLTEEDVLAIRKAFIDSGAKTKLKFAEEKANEYNVHWSSIYRLLSGKQWSHI